MPTEKQRRDAARRHLERQLRRREERDAARKRWTLIATIAGTVVLAVVVVVVVIAVTNDNKKPSANSTTTPTSTSSTSPSASPSSTRSPLPARKPAKIAARAAKKTSGPCGYAESADALKGNPSLFDVGLPPDPSPTPTATRTVVFDTNLGNITAQLDGAGAPCNVQSLTYLVGKKFYDNTACPRSVNRGIFVVQCGDPTASGLGGPTYTTKDENLTKADYTPGTIAMANGGANTNGSQFFFITKDSNQNTAAGTGLGKNYTVVGHVTKGLNILQEVAQAGDDGSNQAGGGRPNKDLIFKTVRLEASNG